MENEFLFEVVEEYFKVHNTGPRKWNFHDFWYWKNVPPKRLKQARKYFAPYNERLERPLLLMTENPLGKLHSGILITNIKLYYHLNLDDSAFWGVKRKKGIMTLSNIRCIDIEPKKYGAWFIVDNNKEAYFASYSEGMVDEDCATPFKNAVNHVLQALHERKPKEIILENGFLLDVVKEYFRVHNTGHGKWPFRTFWYWENITPERLKQFREHFAPYDEELERPLIAMSDNWLWKISRGILITNVKLYYCLHLDDSVGGRKENKGIVTLSSISCIDIKPEDDGAWLIINDNKVAYFSRYRAGKVNEREATPFKNAVNHVLQALHARRAEQ